MIVKVHRTPDGRKIAAVCDKEVIGKLITGNNTQLDLKSAFYKGEEKNADEAVKIMRGSYIINLVGKESVALALSRGLIQKEGVIYLKKIPHAQAILMG